MKTVTCKNWGGLVIVISLLAVSLALAATALAQSSPEQQQVKVVAHLDLSGMHVNGMFVQRHDGKYFLYLHRPIKQAFAVVDVTKPNKPLLVDRATLTDAPHERVEVNSLNPSLAISVSQDDRAAAASSKANPAGDPPAITIPSETVRLVDLSDPKQPKTLKSFSGVTSFLPDDSRRLIYIVNQEGLWIISHRQTRPMPFCTSADALTQEPNCQ